MYVIYIYIYIHNVREWRYRWPRAWVASLISLMSARGFSLSLPPSTRVYATSAFFSSRPAPRSRRRLAVRAAKLQRRWRPVALLSCFYDWPVRRAGRTLPETRSFRISFTRRPVAGGVSPWTADAKSLFIRGWNSKGAGLACNRDRYIRGGFFCTAALLWWSVDFVFRLFWMCFCCYWL